MDSYRTLVRPARASLTRERSRFLAHVEPVASVSDVDVRLAEIRREYRDASHICYAYRCRDHAGIVERASDAGEPSGSAGAPILRQLAAAELLDVLAAVVRYFGGVKLGTGGLVRAYGAVTAAALEQAVIVERRVEVTVRVLFPAEMNAAVLRTLRCHQARVIDIRYDRQGEIRAVVPRSVADALARDLREATGARGRVEELE